MDKIVFSPSFSEISTYVAMAVIAIASVVVCFFAYRLLNAVPAKWLCDYDEEPGEELSGVRYIFKQSGIYTSALFAILNILAFAMWGWSVYTCIIIMIHFVLLLITLSDAKFTIIPDQFIILLAVLCLGFSVYDLCTSGIFISQWWFIPLGAICGGGILFLINIISILVFKKEGMGFGDVKLMLAIGCCAGFPIVLSVLLIGVMIAFVYIVFLVIRRAVSKSDTSSYFPFGPFLCVGASLTLIFVNQLFELLSWYSSLLTL